MTQAALQPDEVAAAAAVPEVSPLFIVTPTPYPFDVSVQGPGPHYPVLLRLHGMMVLCLQQPGSKDSGDILYHLYPDRPLKDLRPLLTQACEAVLGPEVPITWEYHADIRSWCGRYRRGQINPAFSLKLVFEGVLNRIWQDMQARYLPTPERR